MRLAGDLEANELLNENSIDYTVSPYKLKDSFVIHCGAFIDLDTDKQYNFTPDTVKHIPELLAEADQLVFANGINYDYMVMKLYFGLDFTIEPDTLSGKSIILDDTMVMSKALNPDRWPGHSVEAWGKQLGFPKMDWRAEAIKLGLIKKGAPKGAQFKTYHPRMLDYCKQDTLITKLTYEALLEEWGEWDWSEAYELEKKTIEVITRQEHRGFHFYKDKAEKVVKDLDKKMEAISEVVEPLIPPKKPTQVFIKEHSFPARPFLKGDKDASQSLLKFLEKKKEEVTAIYDGEEIVGVQWLGKKYFKEAGKFPSGSIITEVPATLKDSTHIKEWLITKGWVPTDFKDRDLTVNQKKIKLDEEKFEKVVDRYIKTTLQSNFSYFRCKHLGVNQTEEALRAKLLNHDRKKPLKVLTNPSFTIGQEKELCPDLVRLKKEFPYAEDVVHWLTYNHRRNSILGGGLEWGEEEEAEKGYLGQGRIYQDGRIATSADTCGCNCVTADTLIVTDNGIVPITKVGVGDLVLTHEGVYKLVEDKIQNGIKHVLQIRALNGLEIKCTGQHPFLTDTGWVLAKDLKKGMQVYRYQEGEQWSQVESLSRYYISSWGNVITVEGEYLTTNKRKALWSRADVDLTFDIGSKSKRGIGHLVLMAFEGDKPEGKEVCHKDGNPTNNYIGNLYYGTSLENSNDARKHGRHLKGVRSKVNAVLTSEIALEIKTYFKENGYKWGDDTRLAKIYKCSREHLGNIRKGKTWKEGNIENLYKESFIKTVIDSVEPASFQPTFDITVEGAHSYVANGFVTHNTSRFKHRVVANIPRVSSFYGRPIRELFGADPILCYQLGYDFAGLEARIEAAYTYKYPGGRAYATSLIADKPHDIHTVNARKLGTSRDEAKTVKYALTYGSQPHSLAKSMGWTLARAKQVYNDFWLAAKPLKLLKERVEDYWQNTGKKHILGLDGRKIPVRSKHSLLNALFQSAGVICAKRAMILHEEKLKKEGLILDFFKDDWMSKSFAQQMIAYHDEAQMELTKNLVKMKAFKTEEEAEKWKEVTQERTKKILSNVNLINEKYCVGWSVVGETAVYAARESGEYYNLDVALDSDYVIGTNWAECH